MEIEHIRYLNSIAEDIKSSIYNRASISLIIIGVILSISGGNFLANSQTYKLFKLSTLLNIELILIFIFGFLSTLFLVETILPLPNILKISNIIKKQKSQKVKSNKFYSTFSMFNHIINHNRKDFLRKFSKATKDDLSKDLLNSLYDLSHIIQYRYLKLYRASIYLVLMILFFSMFIFTILIENMFLVEAVQTTVK